MKARTEEFLYVLLWTADKLTRPTFRNLDQSFEGWAYRNGLHRRVAELEKQQFLERRNRRDRVYRLTTAGRLRALGGRDVEACWTRPWDGWWRLVSFDVPIAQNRRRDQLRHYLRTRRFGLLQRSLWITPDSVEKEMRLLRKTDVDTKSLILLEARTCGGESNDHIVSAAWDFARINNLYLQHTEILNERPTQKVRNKSHGNALLRWAQREHAAWKNALRNDPLLPKTLLPPGYQGRRAWRNRVEAFSVIGERITKDWL